MAASPFRQTWQRKRAATHHIEKIRDEVQSGATNWSDILEVLVTDRVASDQNVTLRERQDDIVNWATTSEAFTALLAKRGFIITRTESPATMRNELRRLATIEYMTVPSGDATATQKKEGFSNQYFSDGLGGEASKSRG
jgi:hypothetical protein